MAKDDEIRNVTLGPTPTAARRRAFVNCSKYIGDLPQEDGEAVLNALCSLFDFKPAKSAE